jgi:hypothetical protein
MRPPRMSSVVERRLLVNYRVQAEVAASLLPVPLRPRQVGGWAVAGICLIRLGGLRPRWVPGEFGLRSENAAHRIAVEWDGPQGRQTGVYIPRRDSGSVSTSSPAGGYSPVSTTGRCSTCSRQRTISTWLSPVLMARPALASTSGQRSGFRGAGCSLTCGRHPTSSSATLRDSPPPVMRSGSTAWNCARTAGASSQSRSMPFVPASLMTRTGSPQAVRSSTAPC